MPKRFFLFLSVLMLVAACESKPKVSAQKMKHALQRSVFDFNKSMTGFQYDAARTYVATEAGENFDALVAEMENKKFNLLLSDEPPEIDYLKGVARVPVRVFMGEMAAPGKPNASAKELAKRTFEWRFTNGTWLWYGQSSK